jgi:hypothetical protein
MGGARSRIPTTAVLLLALLAGCAHGMGSRQRWNGTSTGSAGDCAPLEFEIVIFEGRVDGWATSALPQGPVSWDVSGSVSPDNQVSVETVTADPRIGQRRVSWRGVRKVLEVSLTQAPPGACQPPRTAILG